MWDWLEDAAGACGRAIESVGDAIASTINAIGDLVGKIPIVGGVFHGLLSIVGAPFNALSALIDGRAIDDVILGQFKDIVSGIREIAPLAQSIISFIPGIGQGINGAIAGAIALANGASLTDALSSAVKNALPGGPITAAAFEAASAAVQGENIFESVGQAALHLLPREAVSALTIVYKAAQGENIAIAALEEAKMYLPLGARIGIDVGIGVGQGRKLQGIVYQTIDTLAPEGVATIGELGKHIINGNTAFSAAMANTQRSFGQVYARAEASGKAAIEILKNDPNYAWLARSSADMLTGAQRQMCSPQWQMGRGGAMIDVNPNKDKPQCKETYGFILGEMGYSAGISIMDRYGMNEDMVKKMREKMLTEADKITFDAAVSTFIGAVMKPPTQGEILALAATVVIDISIPLSPPTNAVRLGIVRDKFDMRDPNIRWDAIRQKIRGKDVYGTLITLRNMVKSSPSAEIRILSPIHAAQQAYGLIPTPMDAGMNAYYMTFGMRHATAEQRVSLARLISDDKLATTVAIEVMKEIKATQSVLQNLWEDITTFFASRFSNPRITA